MGRCGDEHTRLQPRTRPAPPLAAQPGPPVRVAHADPRTGALHLCAGFDPRTGKGYATTAERKRPGECIAFVEPVAREIAPAMTRRHGVLEHGRMHKGHPVQAWWANHPRLVCSFPPGHGSWMHHVEPWFAMVHRQRWRRADLADKKPLAQRLMALVAAWHAQAPPFPWSTKSVATVMAKCENPMAKAA